MPIWSSTDCHGERSHGPVRSKYASLLRPWRLDWTALRRRAAASMAKKRGLRHLPALVATYELKRSGGGSVRYDRAIRAYRHTVEGSIVYDSRPSALHPSAWADRASQIFHPHVTIAPGDVVIDVGAGIGTESIPLARAVEPNGCVVAIEAHPETHRLLKLNLALNTVGNVRTVNVAASDGAGDLYFNDLAMHVSNHGRKGEAPDYSIVVPAIALDSLLGGDIHGPIRLMKVNIEGAETAALNGAEDLLGRTDAVSISCHDFRADRDGLPDMRTYESCKGILERHGFCVLPPVESDSAAVRFILHATRST